MSESRWTRLWRSFFGHPSKRGYSVDGPEMDDRTLNSLLKRRCIPLRGQITEKTAQDCIAQLLFLAHEAPQQPATIYIDSPGGHVTSSIALIRTMDDFPGALSTFCYGEASGTAAVIAAHTCRGLRTAGPDARFSFSLTFADPARAYVEAELSQFDTLFVEIVAQDTNKHEVEVSSLFASNSELSAEDALAFGLIDSISEAPPPTELHAR